ARAACSRARASARSLSARRRVVASQLMLTATIAKMGAPMSSWALSSRSECSGGMKKKFMSRMLSAHVSRAGPKPATQATTSAAGADGDRVVRLDARPVVGAERGDARHEPRAPAGRHVADHPAERLADHTACAVHGLDAQPHVADVDHGAVHDPAAHDRVVAG